MQDNLHQLAHYFDGLFHCHLLAIPQAKVGVIVPKLLSSSDLLGLFGFFGRATLFQVGEHVLVAGEPIVAPPSGGSLLRNRSLKGCP